MNEGTTIGIDFHDDVYYVARVNHVAGRPQISALARFDRDHIQDHKLIADGTLSLALSDMQVMFKDLCLPNTGQHDLQKLAAFEMQQGLLESPDNFQFRIWSTGLTDKYLGTIIRQTTVALVLKAVSQTEDVSNVSVVARSLALGVGYLRFCTQVGGEFVCVADFASSDAAFCFVYRSEIVGQTCLNLTGFDMDSVDGVRAMVAELKTLINFKLASLQQMGVSVPLSSLVLSGTSLTSQLSDQIEQYFGIPAVAISMSAGFFADPDKASQIPLQKYLISLGLTVLDRQ